MSLPDVEKVALAALRAEFPGVTFGTRIPKALVDDLPFATVRRAASARMHPLLATRPQVDVSVWDDDRETASDLARAIQLFIETTPAWSSARATTEPFEVPPPDGATAHALSRFQATYRLVVRKS